jgi:NAD(P)-dependent dehydrogenase (short-subunit alcohol dehydrogenase family)
MATTDRVAVVTGAASGMRLAIVRHLAARAHRVGLLDVHGDAARRAARHLNKVVNDWVRDYQRSRAEV